MHVAIADHSVVICKLFPAQRQDCKSFEDLKDALPWDKIKYIVADKGYYTSTVRSIIKSHGSSPVRAFKGVYLQKDSKLTPQDFYDVKLYKKRNIIERFFGRLKENKRIAMRFDKMDHAFLSCIALAIAKLYKLFC
jgi:transposase